jgi:hypothetical protein
MLAVMAFKARLHFEIGQQVGGQTRMGAIHHLEEIMDRY